MLNLKKLIKLFLNKKPIDLSFSKEKYHFTHKDIKKSTIAKKYKIDNSISEDMEINHNILYTNKMFTALASVLLKYFGKNWSDLTIDSWWRCLKLNKLLVKLMGASPTSDHTEGKAIDFKIKGVSPKEICEFIVQKYFAYDQLIMYKKFVHISFESNVILERNENLISTKDGYKKVDNFS